MSVWLSDPDRPPSLGYGCRFGEEVATDSQGRYRVEAFVPGVETEVTIRGAKALKTPLHKPGEDRDLGDVKATEMH